MRRPSPELPRGGRSRHGCRLVILVAALQDSPRSSRSLSSSNTFPMSLRRFLQVDQEFHEGLSPSITVEFADPKGALVVQVRDRVSSGRACERPWGSPRSTSSSRRWVLSCVTPCVTTQCHAKVDERTPVTPETAGQASDQPFLFALTRRRSGVRDPQRPPVYLRKWRSS